MHQVLVVLQ